MSTRMYTSKSRLEPLKPEMLLITAVVERACCDYADALRSEARFPKGVSNARTLENDRTKRDIREFLNLMFGAERCDNIIFIIERTVKSGGLLRGERTRRS